MNIIQELLDGIDYDHTVEDVIVGTFDCMVLSRGAGLSSTFRTSCGLQNERHCPHGVRNAGSLIGRSAKELASYALSDDLLEASLGIAALNSLLVPKKINATERNAYDLIAEKATGKKLGIVGQFPFIRKLKGQAEISVIQKAPWETEEAIREATKLLPNCDVVALTASSLINHTFDHLIQLCRNAFVVVLGPSTPLTPLLFDYGIDVLCGTFIDDIRNARLHISQGASYRAIRGVKRVMLERSNAGT
jgi:uncharacterized protein (DUF4213/DUF364 family)